MCPTPACQQRQLAWGVGLHKRGPKGKVLPEIERWLYVPTPKGVDFYEQTRKTRRTLFGGAAGGAKSHTLRWGLYRDALRMPGISCLLLRRTYKDLEKNHLKAMLQEVPQLGGTYLESKHAAKFGNGSIIYAGHCETEADAMAYLSSEFDRIAFDELVTFDRDPALEIMTRARTSHPVVLKDGGAQVWAATNPGGTGALWVKQFFIDREVDREEFPRYNPELYGFVASFLEDNPWIDPQYVQDLDEQSEMRRRQLKFGDWNAFVGQFFSQWHETKDGQPWHVRDLDGASLESCEHFASMDWGYSSPGVVLWWACLPDGHYHIRAEYKFKETSAEEVAQAILAQNRNLGIARLRYLVCDPAMKAKTGSGRGESILETLARHGLPMRPGDNDRFNGWARCRDLLRPAPDGVPWLSVSPACVYGRRTIPAQVQDPKDPEDLDTAKDDHWVDAWRYGAMSRPTPTRHRLIEAPTPVGSWGWWRSYHRKKEQAHGPLA